MKPAVPAPATEVDVEDETATGLPVLRTWTRVYLFVLGVFIVWVVLLTALTMMFR
jgi:hypothetical protein